MQKYKFIFDYVNIFSQHKDMRDENGSTFAVESGEKPVIGEY